MPLTVAAGVNMPRLALAMASGASPPRDLSFDEVGIVRQWQEHIIDADGLRTFQSYGREPQKRLAG
jgi:hypothetical protein